MHVAQVPHRMAMELSAIPRHPMQNVHREEREPKESRHYHEGKGALVSTALPEECDRCHRKDCKADGERLSCEWDVTG